MADSPAFATLRQRILATAAPSETDRCLDLGAGTGFLSLPLAQRAASVEAVDLSEAMLASLRLEAERAGVLVATRAANLADLRLADGSFDLIVSSYALHYLDDVDKHALLRRMHAWLAPGGRIVIADMMVGRSFDPHHRQVLRSKAVAMLRRGPAGWWRLAKNIARIGTGRGRLHPCPPSWWTQAVTQAGYREVAYEHVISEAGIVAARRTD